MRAGQVSCASLDTASVDLIRRTESVEVEVGRVDCVRVTLSPLAVKYRLATAPFTRCQVPTGWTIPCVIQRYVRPADNLATLLQPLRRLFFRNLHGVEEIGIRVEDIGNLVFVFFQ